MSPHTILLLSLLQESDFGKSLLKVAIKIDRTKETDWWEYPLDKDSQKILQEKLPLHCRGYEVVAYEHIFEIHEVEYEV